MSRDGNEFTSLPDLTAAIAPVVACRNAALDGEFVHLGLEDKPQFYPLMRRRAPQCFFAFDVLWLNSRDLRGLPLLERKRLLRGIVPSGPSPVLYVDQVLQGGVDLYRAVCEQDMEGIVAKRGDGLYTPEATTWVKVKNPTYSRAAGTGAARAVASADKGA